MSKAIKIETWVQTSGHFLLERRTYKNGQVRWYEQGLKRWYRLEDDIGENWIKKGYYITKDEKKRMVEEEQTKIFNMALLKVAILHGKRDAR